MLELVSTAGLWLKELVGGAVFHCAAFKKHFVS